MRTLVLNRSSLAVSLEGEHLVVRDHAESDSELHRVPLVQVSRVVIAGQPAISFAALAKLMDMRIPCSFLTARGRWRGMMDGDTGFHAGRRARQYQSLANEAFALRIAKWVVDGKLRNSRRTLQRLAANRRMDISRDGSWFLLEACRKNLHSLASVDSVRGVEGTAASCYFKLLSRFFPTSMPFSERTRRPPRDPANALLSFLYTLLEGEVTAAVRAHGLDVAAGYLHRDHERSPSLSLDLMESFRPYFADRLALDLLNHHRLDAERDFEPRDDGGIYLNESGRATVFRAVDDALERRCETVYGRLTLRQIIDRTVCDFIAVLEENAEPRFLIVG